LFVCLFVCLYVPLCGLTGDEAERGVSEPVVKDSRRLRSH